MLLQCCCHATAMALPCCHHAAAVSPPRRRPIIFHAAAAMLLPHRCCHHVSITSRSEVDLGSILGTPRASLHAEEPLDKAERQQRDVEGEDDLEVVRNLPIKAEGRDGEGDDLVDHGLVGIEGLLDDAVLLSAALRARAQCAASSWPTLRSLERRRHAALERASGAQPAPALSRPRLWSTPSPLWTHPPRKLVAQPSWAKASPSFTRGSKQAQRGRGQLTLGRNQKLADPPRLG